MKASSADGSHHAESNISERYIAHGLWFQHGAVLLLRRCDGRYLGGLWDPPGGTVEQNEDPVETVAREFLEETGQLVSVRRELIRQANMDTKGRSIRFWTVAYSVSPEGPVGSITLSPEEHDSWAFVPIADLSILPLAWHVQAAVQQALELGEVS